MRPVYGAARLGGFAFPRPRVLAVVRGDLLCVARFFRFRSVLDRLERDAERELQPARLDDQALVLGDRLALHLPRLGPGLAEDHLCLAPRLLLELGRRTLGGDERRSEERLELLVAHEVALELLDLVGEVGAFTPDVLEARRDLVEEPIGLRPLVPHEAGTGL